MYSTSEDSLFFMYITVNIRIYVYACANVSIMMVNVSSDKMLNTGFNPKEPPKPKRCAREPERK